MAKSATDTQRVITGGMNLRKTRPKAAERTVITTNERIAPVKTVRREYFWEGIQFLIFLMI